MDRKEQGGDGYEHSTHAGSSVYLRVHTGEDASSSTSNDKSDGDEKSDGANDALLHARVRWLSPARRASSSRFCAVLNPSAKLFASAVSRHNTAKKSSQLSTGVLEPPYRHLLARFMKRCPSSACIPPNRHIPEATISSVAGLFDTHPGAARDSRKSRKSCRSSRLTPPCRRGVRRGQVNGVYTDIWRSGKWELRV